MVRADGFRHARAGSNGRRLCKCQSGCPSSWRTPVGRQSTHSGDDYEAYVASHVRRLEALRQAGIVERIDADHSRLPSDSEARGAAFDALRRGRVTLRILSNLDLESQIDANGATWLDRELASPNRAPLVQAGFGTEVSGAMQRRKEALVDQGLA